MGAYPQWICSAYHGAREDPRDRETPELAKTTNGKPDQVFALLRQLENDNQIRRTGQGRGTRWHLITDEDRVAARAAEIAPTKQMSPRQEHQRTCYQQEHRPAPTAGG